MASTVVRRPLPALIALLALLLLTAVVWWRVLHRDNGTTHHAAKTCPSSTAPALTVLPAQKTIQILVLNSTNRRGIATSARASFVASGFRSPKMAGNFTAKHKITTSGQIRYTAVQKPAATLLGYYLPGSQLVLTKRAQKQVTVILGAKYQKLATPAMLRKELAAAKSRINGTPLPTAATSC